MKISARNRIKGPTMRLLLTAIVAALGISQATAQEPVGCDKFKWSLDKERALLSAPDALAVKSGEEIAPPIDKAMKIKLGPLADAKLPMAPEHAPRAADAKAGFVTIASLPKGGPYHITLSAGGWIDVVQSGHFIKSGAFSGALGCERVRKSVRFDLAATPLIVQLSGVPADSIGMVMTPAAR